MAGHCFSTITDSYALSNHFQVSNCSIISWAALNARLAHLSICSPPQQIPNTWVPENGRGSIKSISVMQVHPATSWLVNPSDYSYIPYKL